MLLYLARRIIGIFPTLLIVSFAVFMIIHIIPGDPAVIIAGPGASAEQVAALSIKFGLDKPLLVRYGIWLLRVLHGDLGGTVLSGKPVLALLSERIPATLELALAATLLSILIALPLGILSALRPNRLIDTLGTLFSALFFAVPPFWLAILFMLLFCVLWPWLPPSGRPSFVDSPWLHLQALWLPTLTLALGMAAISVRYVRSALLEVLSQEYVLAARAKGLPESVVLRRYGLRNALIAVVTILGLQLGDLLGGTLIIESLFAWPGVGRLVIQAIAWRDYGLLQAAVLYLLLAFMLVTLVVDVLNGLLDPRVRYG
jgi:peptide/nickel transport system permease protein